MLFSFAELEKKVKVGGIDLGVVSDWFVRNKMFTWEYKGRCAEKPELNLVTFPGAAA